MTYRTGFHDGRLGIGLATNMGMDDGTGNPRYPLDINGDIRLTGAIVDANGDPIEMMAQQKSFPEAISSEDVDIGDGTAFFDSNLKITGDLDFTGTLYQNGSVFTGITPGQSSAITANTAKTGITPGQVSAITANTAKTGITSGQVSAITANTAKVGITTAQAAEIDANTAKTGITSGQVSAITANTAKVGITTAQAAEIDANKLKVSSQWTTSTSKIYYNGGNVGIGTTSPETLLTVGNHPQTDGTRDLVRFSSYKHNEAFTIRNNDDSSNGRLEFFWGNSRNGSGGHDNTVDKSVLTLQHTGKVAINGAVPTTSEGILTVHTSVEYSGIKLMDGGTSLAKMAKYGNSGYFYAWGSAPSTIGGGGPSYIGGRLGVNGITNPDCGLEVEVTNTVAVPTGRAYWFNYEQGHSAANRLLAIHAHGAVWSDNSTGFISTSDRRIKKNIVDVPDNLALEMVRNIPCCYYEYKDNLYSGTDKTIGFIAQEVAEVLPMAISIQTSIIPNELRKLENVSWEQIDNTYKLITDLQDDVSGVKYRFYVSNDVSGNDEIKKEIIGNSDNTFTFDSSYNNVFCYGKEVDDFHTLDKNKLFALNFSATQELDRQQQADKARIADLEAKNTALENTIQTLISRITALENK